MSARPNQVDQVRPRFKHDFRAEPTSIRHLHADAVDRDDRGGGGLAGDRDTAGGHDALIHRLGDHKEERFGDGCLEDNGPRISDARSAGADGDYLNVVLAGLKGDLQLESPITARDDRLRASRYGRTFSRSL